ncbi:MAG: hypothetical protein M0R38_10080 [Bacteroidia bacterium]|nr:hypothetical protein [Bacteroidia bacterium]
MTFKKLKELINEVKKELLIIDGVNRRYISAWEDGYYDGASAAYRNILIGLEEIVKDEMNEK